MALDPAPEATTALNRFGLGARPGDIARVGSDPRGFLKADLDPDRALISPEQVDTGGGDGGLARPRGAEALRGVGPDAHHGPARRAEGRAGDAMGPVAGRARLRGVSGSDGVRPAKALFV